MFALDKFHNVMLLYYIKQIYIRSMSKLVDLNHISKEFVEQIYNNDEELILVQLFSSISELNKETYQEFIDNLNIPHTEFHIMKLFKANIEIRF